jgi:hypothetical protein
MIGPDGEDNGGDHPFRGSVSGFCLTPGDRWMARDPFCGFWKADSRVPILRHLPRIEITLGDAPHTPGARMYLSVSWLPCAAVLAVLVRRDLPPRYIASARYITPTLLLSTTLPHPAYLVPPPSLQSKPTSPPSPKSTRSLCVEALPRL